MKRLTSKPQSSTKVIPHKNHWSLGLLTSMKDPTKKVKEDDKIVVIKDAYPKARFHYLILPKENIPKIWDVTDKHKDLILHMDHVAEELINEHVGFEFKVGYHAMPSMNRLHLHVISTDFNSQYLKTKHHWNSFTTPFFIDSKDICKQLCEKGKLERIQPEVAKKYLNLELKCHKCSLKPKNMGELKRHLTTHLSTKQ